VTKLTVTVITKNESAHIDACLASVAWADEVLVVDSGSPDGTADRARARGARVLVRVWPGYSAQKNFAAGEAAHDWILSVDADERVTPALSEEIRRHLAAPAGPSSAGYRIPRVTWHLGRWIRTTDWYPDFQLRLYDRRRARWKPKRVHESVEIDAAGGAAGQLESELEHYAYRDINHHLDTMNRYTTLAAEEMHEAGRRASTWDLVAHPAAAFLRNYVLRRGFTDGAAGFIISSMNAHYVFLKFAKLWALARQQPPQAGGPPSVGGNFEVRTSKFEV
jgi:glycosyltransferase involved in cell wall biosynthesis